MQSVRKTYVIKYINFYMIQLRLEKINYEAQIVT